MDIKSQLIDILKKEDYTFDQLAEYLQISEDQLTSALNDKTLVLRDLEIISKLLRVPLYSFFRMDSSHFNFNEKPFYINRLWTGDDAAKSKAQLNVEINLLKQIISLKEEQLKKLNS